MLVIESVVHDLDKSFYRDFTIRSDVGYSLHLFHMENLDS